MYRVLFCSCLLLYPMVMQDSTGRTCKNRFPTIRREDRSTVLSPYLSFEKGRPKNFYSRLGRRAKPTLIGTLKHVRGVKALYLLREGRPKNFYSRLGQRARPALIGPLKHVRGVKVFCLLREGRPKNFDWRFGRRAKPALMWRQKRIQGVVDHSYSRKTTTAGGEGKTHTMFGGHKPPARHGCSVTLLSR